MTQLTLFDHPTASARNSDPESSHDAARYVESSGVAEIARQRILEALGKEDGMTGHEIAFATGMTEPQVMRRMKEIETGGAVYRGDPKFTPHSRVACVTWWKV